jgi:hypothetical protein
MNNPHTRRDERERGGTHDAEKTHTREVMPKWSPMGWSSADGLAVGAISIDPPDGPWPPMVKLTLEGPACEFEFSMLADDARDLGAALSAASGMAHPRFFRSGLEG